MLHLIGQVPREKFYLCCSGGIDSMAMYKLLIKYPHNDFEVLYFNHGTEHGNDAEKFLIENIKDRPLHIGRISRPRLAGESIEEYWRNERYGFFDRFKARKVLCHHLDDAVEWWIFTSLHGEGKLIPYSRGNYIKPLLLNNKDQLIEFLGDFKYIQDESNFQEDHARNIIRNSLMKQALRINPGIRTTIRNKLLKLEYGVPV